MAETLHHGDHSFLSGRLKKFRYEEHATLAAELDGTPREGRIVYTLNTRTYYGGTNTGWIEFGGAGGGAPYVSTLIAIGETFVVLEIPKSIWPIPQQWMVSFNFLRATGSGDWIFSFARNGVPFGLETDVSGDGTGKAISFPMRATTPLLAANDTISIMVKSASGTPVFNNIQGSFDMEFAGVT